jgi:hypothetical protein
MTCRPSFLFVRLHGPADGAPSRLETMGPTGAARQQLRCVGGLAFVSKRSRS